MFRRSLARPALKLRDCKQTKKRKKQRNTRMKKQQCISENKFTIGWLMAVLSNDSGSLKFY
jgi:hypothetical protein